MTKGKVSLETQNVVKETAFNGKDEQGRLTCGIVMPISSMPDCPKEHWSEVRRIISEAAENAGFEASLVSAADETTVIQRTIVHRLFKDDIVVCDVSAKNPNVMFELGLRIAFGKPVVVIKDDATEYSFDVAPLEHVIYPRSLRHFRIVDFVKELSVKISRTYGASLKNDHVPFIKAFGEINTIDLVGKSITAEQALLTQNMDILDEMRQIRSALSNSITNRAYGFARKPGDIVKLFRRNYDDKGAAWIEAAQPLEETPAGAKVVFSDQEIIRIVSESVNSYMREQNIQKLSDSDVKMIVQNLPLLLLQACSPKELAQHVRIVEMLG